MIFGFRGKNTGKMKEFCQERGKSGNFELKIGESVQSSLLNRYLCEGKRRSLVCRDNIWEG